MYDEWDQREEPHENPEPVFELDSQFPVEHPESEAGQSAVNLNEAMEKVYELQKSNRKLREENETLKSKVGVGEKTKGQLAYERYRGGSETWAKIDKELSNALLLARNYAQKNNQPWPVERGSES